MVILYILKLDMFIPKKSNDSSYAYTLWGIA